MNNNNWNNFLLDEELNNSHGFHSPPDGRYLFGKILHDVLQYLNSFKGIGSLIVKLGEKELEEIEYWFNSKKPHIDFLINQITPLWQYHQNLKTSSPIWPKLIQKVGDLLDYIPKWINEIEQFEEPAEIMGINFLKMTITNLKSLNKINEDIDTENYKRLWSIIRY